jgi:DNA-directed RNA polymerase specialized sigma24 family protein
MAGEMCGEAWTDSDIELLEFMFGRGFGDSDIADELGRTAKAVQSKRLGMGLLRAVPREVAKVTPNQIKEITQMRFCGYSYRFIAEKVDIDKNTVSKYVAMIQEQARRRYGYAEGE